jgi:hypothetical protein
MPLRASRGPSLRTAVIVFAAVEAVLLAVVIVSILRGG